MGIAKTWINNIMYVALFITTSPVASTPATTDILAIALGSSLGIVTLLLVIAMVIAVCVLLCWKRRKSKTTDDIELSVKSSTAPRRLRGMTQIVKAKRVIFNSNIRLLDSIGEGNMYNLSNNYCLITFSVNLCLGEFGIVYKAHLILDINGMPEMVAVKTMKRKFLYY